MLKKYIFCLFCFMGLTLTCQMSEVRRKLHIASNNYEKILTYKGMQFQNREIDLGQMVHAVNFIQKRKEDLAAALIQTYWIMYRKELVVSRLDQSPIFDLLLNLSLSHKKPQKVIFQLYRTSLDYEKEDMEVRVFAFKMSFGKDMPKIPDYFGPKHLMSVYMQAMQKVHDELGEYMIGNLGEECSEPIKSREETIEKWESLHKSESPEIIRDRLTKEGFDCGYFSLQDFIEWAKVNPEFEEYEKRKKRQYIAFSSALTQLLKNPHEIDPSNLGCRLESFVNGKLTIKDPSGALHLFERNMIQKQLLAHEKFIKDIEQQLTLNKAKSQLLLDEKQMNETDQKLTLNKDESLKTRLSLFLKNKLCCF